ncbi:MAG: glycoside hydrolase family 3 protein [Christensenellales bacterium]|jgi:beta-glucosidase
MKFKTYAKQTPEITAVEQRNRDMARQCAREGIVLLKNNGILPIVPCVAALFGGGAEHTVKGGTGSGEVNPRHVVSIREGMETAGFVLTSKAWLEEYNELLTASRNDYTRDMRKRTGFLNFSAVPFLLSHPFNNPVGRQIRESDVDADAKVCFYVLSRQAGENVDRTSTPGSYCLTEREIDNIRFCKNHFPRTVLVINVGGYLDISPLSDLNLDAIIYFGQQGGEGGHGLADVLTGKVAPSGHLTSTWYHSYADVPFGGEFSLLNGDLENEDYKEGIYVGYRYADSFGVEPMYPFGYGLSYTNFSMETTVTTQNGTAFVSAKVKNIGHHTGKAVVQVYVSCPVGTIHKEYQRLAGFGKTTELNPGHEQTIIVSFGPQELASYDESRNCYVLEAGDYIIRVGEHSRNTKTVACLRLSDEKILSHHHAICPKQRQFEELQATGSEAETIAPVIYWNLDNIETVTHNYAPHKKAVSPECRKLLDSMSIEDAAYLCVGSGLDIALPKNRFFMVPGACGFTTGKLEKKGVPSVAYCDGPAGLRMYDESVITGNTVRMVKPVMRFMEMLPWVARKVMFGNPKGKKLYQYATAFPSGLSMAQSWNTALLEAEGMAIRAEMEEFGVAVWLAPAINIHRNPLCGRNYEYYSEDPLLAGKLAAAVTRGVQCKPGFGVTLKHFCCNNQETQRRWVSENVSQRTIREIYIRAFEIAIKEAAPKAIMSSYNKVNGIYTAHSYDLLTKVVRCEWGYQGQIMTDWVTEKNLLDADKAMNAGVDLMMPGISSDRKKILAALKNGTLKEEKLRENAVYVLNDILETHIYKLYQG